MACVGRYILKNSIFKYLEQITEGVGGEVQLTDAIAIAQNNEPVFASTFNGKRYDIGNKLGYVEATIIVAKYREDLKEGIHSFLKEIEK